MKGGLTLARVLDVVLIVRFLRIRRHESFAAQRSA